jgi:uncharacterized protein YecE (DUF72 family)
MTDTSGSPRILIGTCNWADHTDFYPPELEKSSRQRDKLAWYAQFFPIVEVDSSFYAIPRPATTERWAHETPSGFTFNVKAFRTFTGHGLPDDRYARSTEEQEREFAEALKPLREAGKLGAVHYQFPPWAIFGRVQNREAIVDAVERHPADVVAIEFRHRSWYDADNFPQAEDLLRELGAVWVAVDEPQHGRATAPPVAVNTNPKLAIVRFHGRNEATWYKHTGSSRDRFDYDYSSAELAEWRPKIEAMEEAAQTIHLLMNTNNRNQGPANAYRLARVLGSPLPPPPASLQFTLGGV